MMRMQTIVERYLVRDWANERENLKLLDSDHLISLGI
jgi:hypothetical protein